MPNDPTAEIDALIKQAAARNGIEYALLKAHVKRESDFRDYVVREEPSINDASIGLVQVLVKTAQWIMDNPNITRQDLLDPAFNLDVGAKYIKYQLSRYSNDVKKAIAAYNAGSAKYKSDGITFINQPYVDFVYEWYQKYKSSTSNLILSIAVSMFFIGGLLYFRHQL